MGTGNNVGNLTIGSTYGIGGFMDGSEGNTVYKTGITTGTTSGPITGTCVDLPAHGSPARSVSCQYEVLMRSDAVDSGAPVYMFVPGMQEIYRGALGIFHTTYNPQFQGDNYKAYYSPMSVLRANLGNFWPF